MGVSTARARRSIGGGETHVGNVCEKVRRVVEFFRNDENAIDEKTRGAVVFDDQRPVAGSEGELAGAQIRITRYSRELRYIGWGENVGDLR